MTHLETAVQATAEAAQQLAGELPGALGRRGWTVAAAESLTGGAIASVLAAAPQASQWFRGGVVAYTPQVKYDLLGCPPGPVVTEETARTLATATAAMLGADLCVAVTGVGGPDPDEGEAAGTVWFAVAAPDGTRTQKVVFDGAPADVLAATTEHALALLQEVADGA